MLSGQENSAQENKTSSLGEKDAVVERSGAPKDVMDHVEGVGSAEPAACGGRQPHAWPLLNAPSRCHAYHSSVIPLAPYSYQLIPLLHFLKL